MTSDVTRETLHHSRSEFGQRLHKMWFHHAQFEGTVSLRQLYMELVEMG